ncbi:MAG: DNA primase [Gammaproteobacteria bacterium]|nr:DNA primase [Gammaproteobacteria bacterium]
MAGRIPEKFIDELLTRIDIVEVIDRRVPLKKAGKDFKACCPFHNEKTPSFTVSQPKQFFHCFGCGAHGSAIGFLMDYERLGFPEAVEYLAQEAGIEVPRELATQPGNQARRQDELAPLYALMAEADKFYQRQLREHPAAQFAVDYLKGRGLTGAIAKRFSLGFAPESWDGVLSALATDDARKVNLEKVGLLVRKEETDRYYDRFRGRVMFPIHDQRGRVIGFGGRVIGKGEPKYLNSPETPLFHKGREMYGLYLAREGIRRRDQVLVVEGYMDVVALAQYGIDYAVATLGTATTRDHLDRIFRYAAHVVFCFDGDRAGRDAAWRALEQALPLLQEGRQVSFLFLPEGEDPDSLVRKEGREAFESRLDEQAVAAPEYLFKELLAQTDTSRIDGRARLIELARPHIQQVSVGLLRDMMVDRLAELSGVALDRVREAVGTAVKVPMAETKSQAPTEKSAILPNRGRAGLAPKSLERKAVLALLQFPGAASRAGDTGFLADLPTSGAAMLVKLLDVARQIGADASTAQLLERFRDDGLYRALVKLASEEWEGATDLAAELSGALGSLKDKVHREKVRSVAASTSTAEDWKERVREARDALKTRADVDDGKPENSAD